jgi:transcriptional regulator with XRE-family HTH domain
MSGRELARRANVSTSAVSKWRRGTMPRKRKLKELAKLSLDPPEAAPDPVGSPDYWQETGRKLLRDDSGVSIDDITKV